MEYAVERGAWIRIDPNIIKGSVIILVKDVDIGYYFQTSVGMIPSGTRATLIGPALFVYSNGDIAPGAEIHFPESAAFTGTAVVPLSAIKLV